MHTNTDFRFGFAVPKKCIVFSSHTGNRLFEDMLCATCARWFAGQLLAIRKLLFCERLTVFTTGNDPEQGPDDYSIDNTSASRYDRTWRSWSHSVPFKSSDHESTIKKNSILIPNSERRHLIFDLRDFRTWHRVPRHRIASTVTGSLFTRYFIS